MDSSLAPISSTSEEEYVRALSPLSIGSISAGVDSIVDGALRFNEVSPSPEPENGKVKDKPGGERTKDFSQQTGVEETQGKSSSDEYQNAVPEELKVKAKKKPSTAKPRRSSSASANKSSFMSPKTGNSRAEQQARDTPAGNTRTEISPAVSPAPSSERYTPTKAAASQPVSDTSLLVSGVPISDGLEAPATTSKPRDQGQGQQLRRSDSKSAVSPPKKPVVPPVTSSRVRSRAPTKAPAVASTRRREEMSPRPLQQVEDDAPWKRLCPHHQGQQRDVEQALQLNDDLEQGQRPAPEAQGHGKQALGAGKLRRPFQQEQDVEYVLQLSDLNLERGQATDQDQGKGEAGKGKGRSALQQQQIQQALRNAPILSWLNPQTMKRVMDAVQVEQVHAGQVVVYQGHSADRLHIVAAGTFQFFVLTDFGLKFVHVLHGRGSFGEISLLYTVPRQTMCVAATDGTLLSLERADFRSLVVGAARRKWDYYKPFIQSVAMLAVLEPHEKLMLAGAMTSLSARDGQCIYKQGDTADGMYFVVRGQVTLVSEKQATEGSRRTLQCHVLPTQHFGTSDVVEGKRRSNSAFADGEAELCFVQRDCVHTVLSSCHEVIKKSATLHSHI